MLSRAARVEGDDGAPPTFIGTLTDITARKQAEQQLALGSEVMRDMAEGVCVVRATDAKIVFVNPTFEQMMGYEPGELCGESLIVLQPRLLEPDDQCARPTRSPSASCATARSPTTPATAARTAR